VRAANTTAGGTTQIVLNEIGAEWGQFPRAGLSSQDTPDLVKQIAANGWHK